METSDSECFESADEDFYSDDEDKVIKKAPIQKSPAQEVPDLKDLSLEDTRETHSGAPHSSKKHEEHPPHTDKPERKDRQPKAKLGVKLGAKVKKSDLNLPESDGTCISEDSSSAAPKVAEKLETDAVPRRVVKTKTKEAPKTVEKLPKTVEKTPDIDENLPETVAKQSPERCASTDGWDDFEAWPQDSPKKVESGKVQEENMWEDDASWEPISSRSREDSKTDANSSWMGWGNWDVSSLLNTATAGVTTITNHVSQGLTTVLESGIRVPEPEELARIHREENKKIEELVHEDSANEKPSNLSFGLGNFVSVSHITSGVSQITKLVETTGTKVIAGGLDTLETIGKKTMEVLQEGDPGLKKKRAFLKIDSNKPVLSHILREAKEKAEQENKLLEEKRFAKKANYETLFDDHQGLVHLEALEMLSKQCDIKLQTLLESHSGSELTEMQETMSQVNELCELNEEEEEEPVDLSEMKEKLDAAVAEMNVRISYDKLISTWAEAEEWLDNVNLNVCDEIELHEQAIETLAQLTAIAVEQFHKIGALLLIKDHRSTADESDSLVQLTTLLTALISHVATKLSNKLNEKATSCTNKEQLNSLITNVYFEAANSSSYIKNAFQLLIPVLQVGAV